MSSRNDATQGLFLSGTQVTDAGVVHLQGLTQLQRLSLGEAQVTDAGLVHLRGLTQLQDLSLYLTQVTDAGLVHLKGLTQLQDLYLKGTQVTDAGERSLHKALRRRERVWQVADPADKIKELQKERIAALRELAAMAAEKYSQARLEAKDAYKPRLLLLNAQVELAETQADRIALFKGAIDDLNKLEEFFKAWWTKKTGKALSQPVLPVLQIRSQRLGVEIELERAEREPSPSSAKA